MNGRQLKSFDVVTPNVRLSQLRGGAVLLLAATVAWLALAAPASAVTLFWEDFNGYTYFPDDHPAGDPINFGTPITAEGADNNWYGGRFETPDGSVSSDPIEDIYLDIGVQKIPGGTYPGSSTPKPSVDPVGRAGDDAGLLFKVDTTNFTNVILDFEWRNFSADGTDRIVVGYTTLDLDPYFTAFDDGSLTVPGSVATPGGGNPNLIADFFNDPAIGNGSQTAMETWWATNWTELLRDQNNDWQLESFSLPSTSPEVWIAFWMDNGDGDFAKIDNIHVSAQVVPEPSSFVIAGLGIALCGCVAVRRRFASKKGQRRADV